MVSSLKQMVSLSAKIVLFLMILLYLADETIADMHLNEDSPRCKYGIFDTWFSLNGSIWINTTVDNIVLKRGQPFYIKLEVFTILDDIWISIMFSEVGESNIENSTYELIDGPDAFYKPFDIGRILHKNTFLNYTWKFRVKRNTTWINGNAPLDIMVQFDRKIKDEWDYNPISYTVVNAFIDEKQWVDKEYNNDPNINAIDGFQVVFIIISIFLIISIKNIS